MEFDHDTQLRIIAVQTAAGNAKAGTSPVKVAEDIYNFLTEGASSPSKSTKPASDGAKAKKADAPDTGSDAKGQSSDKPAEEKAAKTSTATSPSEDKGSGFTDDGSEITLDDIRTAAVKFSAHPKGGEKKFVAKLKELGSDNLSGLDPARYGELISYLNGATAEAETAKEEVSPFE